MNFDIEYMFSWQELPRLRLLLLFQCSSRRNHSYEISHLKKHSRRVVVITLQRS